MIALVAALAACGPNPNGQGVTDTGTVVGTVVDSRTPTTAIASATVQIGLQVQRLSPADNGHFTLNNVPTGSQTISISAIGYQQYNNTVVVRANQTSDVGVIGLASQTGL